MLSAEERKFLRKKLPKGYGKLIAKEAGLTQASVSFWFSGRHNSEEIEVIALRLFQEYKEIMRKRKEILFQP